MCGWSGSIGVSDASVRLMLDYTKPMLLEAGEAHKWPVCPLGHLWPIFWVKPCETVKPGGAVTFA